MIEVAQDMFEHAQLLGIVRVLAPERILEVGVWHGGTLWDWIQTADSVTGVDDTMFEADDWMEWAEEAGTTLMLIQGDSRDSTVIEQARAGGPFDFVFIDAAHDYESVRSDWENYSPMVAAGGAIAFHDINPREDYGVAQLWQEIKRGSATIEINAGIPGYCGIGVLFG